MPTENEIADTARQNAETGCNLRLHLHNRGMSQPFDITDSAARQVALLLQEERAAKPGARLRVSVLGGGCSGFQYHFEFDDAMADNDLLIEREGAAVVIDDVSLGFLEGSVLDYVETLGEASFQIKNPNATAKCGCGNSFAV